MIDSTSVIGMATHGIVKKLAEGYEVSLSRMYEMLGAQCSYPKTRKLIREIARINGKSACFIMSPVENL